jgi:hypothetical protein
MAYLYQISFGVAIKNIKYAKIATTYKKLKYKCVPSKPSKFIQIKIPGMECKFITVIVQFIFFLQHNWHENWEYSSFTTKTFQCTIRKSLYSMKNFRQNFPFQFFYWYQQFTSLINTFSYYTRNCLSGKNSQNSWLQWRLRKLKCCNNYIFYLYSIAAKFLME